MQNPHRRVVLSQGKVEIRKLVFRHRQVLPILSHTHHLPQRRIRRACAETLAEWVLVGPIARRHSLVDDGRARRMLIVGFGERTAAQDARLQSVEVGGIHNVGPDRRGLGIGFHGPPFDEDELLVTVVAHGDAERQTGGLHSR